MITKTDYVIFRSCPRAYYYQLHDPKQAKPTDEVTQKRIDEGKVVGSFAHLYFANTVKVKDNPNVVNIKNQVEVTKKLLPTSNYIAEASFQFDDLFCAVDILAKNGSGYDIYEVKASTDVYGHLKDYAPDVAFQKYVLELCGLEIKNCYILYLNPDFVKHGDIDAKQLLVPYQLNALHEELKKPDKILNLFKTECELVAANVSAMRNVKNLPEYGKCGRDCPFFAFCHKDLPANNVTDINHIKLDKAHKWIKDNIITFDDALGKKEDELNNYQKIQIKTTLGKYPSPFVNKTLLKKFLDKLTYPLYHLDFETMNEAIPEFDGVGPYKQVPFQYSLHIESSPGVIKEHKEYLGKKLDCAQELVKQLCDQIPDNVMVIAYNMKFEKMVLKDLANRFPDDAKHLMAIHDNMVDLFEPFAQGVYYNAKQGRSTSIKYVMPALCPQREKAYKDLKVVHNGGEALAMFPKMVNEMCGKQFEETYKGMLAYCEQDTLSMVDVLNALWKIVKE